MGGQGRPRRLRVIVEADGGARGNPGPAGYGVVVREAATGEVLVERGESLGQATNNVAEYSGLVAGLSAAADLGAVEVEVRMDSQLVVEQMSGRWQIRNAGLRPLAAKAAALATRFESVRYTWVPRERNVAADALANAAMDAAHGTAAPAPTRAPAPGPAPASPASPPSFAPRPVADATRLILVRHGQTTLNAEQRYSGRAEAPLTPAGEAQLPAIAERVAALVRTHAEAVGGEPPAAVVTSPLARCRVTASAVAARLGAAVAVENAFVECDFGEWEGRAFDEVRRQWPGELAAWLDSTAVAPPGGESFVDVAARVAPAVRGLVASHPGRVVVVVSHVAPIKLILRDALEATDALLQRLFLDPGGISVVDWWRGGATAVRMVNLL